MVLLDLLFIQKHLWEKGVDWDEKMDQFPVATEQT